MGIVREDLGSEMCDIKERDREGKARYSVSYPDLRPRVQEGLRKARRENLSIVGFA